VYSTYLDGDCICIGTYIGFVGLNVYVGYDV